MGYRKLQYYLLRREFRVVTDHLPLEWLNEAKEKEKWLTQWSTVNAVQMETQMVFPANKLSLCTSQELVAVGTLLHQLYCVVALSIYLFG